jgi:hypothetical protein
MRLISLIVSAATRTALTREGFIWGVFTVSGILAGLSDAGWQAIALRPIVNIAVSSWAQALGLKIELLIAIWPSVVCCTKFRHFCLDLSRFF